MKNKTDENTETRNKTPTRSATAINSPGSSGSESNHDDSDSDDDDYGEDKDEWAPLPDPEKSLQILDLHTENPLISFRNTMYSCHWMEISGTEMFFTPPDEVEEDNEDVDEGVRKREVAFLGTSKVRLHGLVANLKPKEKTKALLASEGRKFQEQLDRIHATRVATRGVVLDTSRNNSTLDDPCVSSGVLPQNVVGGEDMEVDQLEAEPGSAESSKVAPVETNDDAVAAQVDIEMQEA